MLYYFTGLLPASLNTDWAYAFHGGGGGGGEGFAGCALQSQGTNSIGGN